MKTDGVSPDPTNTKDSDVENNIGAAYNCPNCSRSTLRRVPEEIVEFKCEVCGARVREEVVR